MSDEKVYYFDNNATTRVAPEVVETMIPFLSEHWGNLTAASMASIASTAPVAVSRWTDRALRRAFMPN